MSEFKENLEKVERLLKVAQIHEEYADCKNLYDFLGIDKTATKEEIKASIGEKHNFYLSKQNVSDWEALSEVFISSQSAIEYILFEYRPEYDNYLIALKVKDLRKHFISHTRANHELDSEEKRQLIEKGTDIGLSETQIIKIIGRWMEEYGVKPAETSSPSDSSSGYVPYDELLGKTYYEIFGTPNDTDYSETTQIIKIIDRWMEKDGVKPAEASSPSDSSSGYQSHNEAKQEVEDGTPILKVIFMKDDYFVYKDVKKGTSFTETIVIKNEHEGQLKGNISSDAEWLVPERENLTSTDAQILDIHVLTSKIPVNTYDAKGTITIDSNGGPPYLISFRVILEDLEIAADRFRKTYVPLMAVGAGFIGSFSGLSFLNFLIIAILGGIISYSIAEFVVKASLKNGLNIFKFPSTLIQGAAVVAAILIILSHSSLSSFIKQKVEQEKLDITFLSEKQHVPVARQPEQSQPLPEAENKQVIVDPVDQNRQSSLTDDIFTKAIIALSGSLTTMDPKTVGSDALWRFGFETMNDRTHYGFECNSHDELHFRVDGNNVDWTAGTEAMRVRPNRLTLYVRFQDWDIVQKCSKESRCDQSPCPLAIVIEPNTNAQNTPHQSPLADALKSPSVGVEPSKPLRKNTRIASNKVEKKKWKPKMSSFAPPSRDNL